MRAHRVRLVSIVQIAVAFQNEINFFYTIVDRALAIALGIERDFAKTDNTLQSSTIRIAFTEDCLVVASRGRKIGPCFAQTWNVTM